MIGLWTQVGAQVGALAARALSRDAGDLDRRIIDTVAGHRTEWATDVADATMYIGTTPSVLGATLLIGIAVVVALRALRAGVVVGVSLMLAIVSAELLKSVFERPRPPSALALASAHGYSFPSTQATETSAVAVSLIVLLLGPGWGERLTVVLPRRAQVVVAGVLVVAVGFVGVCMVYLGAHWPTDVVAGWVLGTAIGAAVGWVGSRVGRADPPSQRLDRVPQVERR